MKRPMLLGVGTLIAGELTAGITGGGQAAALVLPAVCFICFFGKGYRREILWSCICFLLGVLRFTTVSSEAKIPDFWKEDAEVSVTGTVSYYAEQTSGWSIYLEDATVFAPEVMPIGMPIGGGSNQKHCKKILISAKELPDLEPGNRVCLRVSAQPFKRAENKGNYDELQYYYAKGIFFAGTLLYVEERMEDVRVIPAFLLECKERWKEVFRTVYPEKQAAFYQGVLLGDAKAVDPEQKTLFRENGIGHILAISGLHLSMIGMAVFRLCRRRKGYLFSGVCAVTVMLCFCYLTGSSVSTVRALLMFSLKMGAMVTGRTGDTANELSAAAFFMLAEQPYYLFDAGFQMSCACIAILALAIPVVTDYLHLTRGWKQGLAAALLLQIFLLPLNAYYYFDIPLYGCLLNLLVIPTMAVVLGSGLFCMFLGMFSAVAAAPAAGPGAACIRLYEMLCRLADKLPYSHVTVGQPPFAAVITVYLVLTAVLIYCRKKVRNENGGEPLRYRTVRKRACLIAMVMIFMLVLIHPGMKEDFSVRQLYVGQGDCCLIQERGGLTVMIDGGSSSESSVAKYRIVPFLKSEGICKLDYVIVSHPDMDHISGILELLRGEGDIRIGAILIADYGENENYQQLLMAAKERGCEVINVYQDMKLMGKQMLFHFLSPKKGNMEGGDVNESSVVFTLEWNGFTALFTGDIGEKTEKTLLLSDSLQECDWLKVSHHGSRYSSCEAFLGAVNADACVISAGKNNRYGHPHEETMERLKQNTQNVFLTSEDGCVSVMADGERQKVTTYFQERKDSLLEKIMLQY